MAGDGIRNREGEVLKSKYRLERRLGVGGMAEVYRALNTLIDRVVAIKMLHPEYAASRTAVERFLREARAANLVRHPNVVEVLDVDQDDFGLPFIVQEYLEGEDLASRLEKYGGKLPAPMALRLLLPVVEAIGAAHVKGLVHRDLKPGNIFLARGEGRAVSKVLDFGISKMPVDSEQASLTVTGTVLGSPAYMSPEQIQNPQSVDVRADVWALGVILYQVLSGQFPCDADTPAALFVQICTADPIPLQRVAPELPAQLISLVMRCLRRDRNERFRDANELAEALRGLLQSKQKSQARGAQEQPAADTSFEGTPPRPAHGGSARRAGPTQPELQVGSQVRRAGGRAVGRLGHARHAHLPDPPRPGWEDPASLERPGLEAVLSGPASDPQGEQMHADRSAEQGRGDPDPTKLLKQVMSEPDSRPEPMGAQRVADRPQSSATPDAKKAGAPTLPDVQRGQRGPKSVVQPVAATSDLGEQAPPSRERDPALHGDARQATRRKASSRRQPSPESERLPRRPRLSATRGSAAALKHTSKSPRFSRVSRSSLADMGYAVGHGMVFGAMSNVLVATLLVVGVALSLPYLEFGGLHEARSALGANAYMLFGVAALVPLLAAIPILLQANQFLSVGLFAAALGLLGMAACLALAAAFLATPGSALASLYPIAAYVAPWAAAAIPLGLAAFGLFWARRELRVGGIVHTARGVLVVALSAAALVVGFRLAERGLRSQDKLGPDAWPPQIRAPVPDSIKVDP